MINNDYALTAKDVKALQTCDRLCYHYDRAAGTSEIDAIKKGDDTYPWEQQYRVKVNTSVESYQSGYQVRSAFSHLTNYKHGASEVNTALSFLKAGDILQCHLVANNNSKTLDDTCLHHDMLYLHIRRGKKEYCFLVQTSICPNNSARMCQMEPR